MCVCVWGGGVIALPGIQTNPLIQLYIDESCKVKNTTWYQSHFQALQLLSVFCQFPGTQAINITSGILIKRATLSRYNMKQPYGSKYLPW